MEVNLGDNISPETENFHNVIREVIIEFLVFLVLVTISHIVVRYFRERPETEDYSWLDKEDRRVYQVTQAICTISLSVTLAGVLLLPFSIVSNEVLLAYPKSYYIQWLNSSLVQVLWNSVSFSANLTFFILMPFAYFFVDAQGFAGTKNTIWSRVFEAMCFLILLMIAIFGMVWVLTTPFRDKDRLIDLWQFYLPLVHSVVSFTGVVFLLACCPVGLMTSITGMAGAVAGWKALRQLPVSFDEQLHAAHFEEESLKRKVDEALAPHANGWHFTAHPPEDRLLHQLNIASDQRRDLEHRQKYWWVPALYLAAIACLTLLTSLALCYVAVNIVGIVVGLRSVTPPPTSGLSLSLGLQSMSLLGWVGACFQIVLILFLLGISLVGAYSLPPMRYLRPHKAGTSLSRLLASCTCLLLVSSAIPLQTRLLGITNANLLGSFSRFDWLGNSVLVLLYNAAFVGAFVLCATRKMKQLTADFWTEVFAWFKTVYRVCRERTGPRDIPD